MIKLIGFLMIFLGCLGIAFYAIERKARRIQLLEEWEEVLLYLQGEISYSGCSLLELMCRLGSGQRVMQGFWKKMESALLEKDGGSFGQIWEKTLREDVMTGFLEEQDREILYHIGKNLGQTDRSTQLHTIQVFRERLHQRLEAAQGEFYQKKKVCIAVGITTGMMLGILFL